MSSGFTQLQNAVDNQLVPGSQSIENGVNDYTKGLDTISFRCKPIKWKKYNFNNKFWINWFLDQVSWQKNSSTLTTGLDSLAEKTPELVTGIEKLSSGSNQLNSKSSDLIAGLDKIQLGSSQLTDKSSSIAFS